MTRRSSRSDHVKDPEHLLRVIGACRAEVVRASAGVKAYGPVYHALSMVITAIDALATMITGNAYHFSIGGSVLTEQQRAVMEREKEAGR